MDLTNKPFGQYRIVRLLGRGGMGEVYEAEHRVLQRRYALKLLPEDFASRPEAVHRFEREAAVMANLEHAHIVRVDEFGETDGRYWLRMELVKGAGAEVVTLGEYAARKGGKLEPGEFTVILEHILEGLAYAHGKGVVHRDLKPGNILLDKDAAGYVRVKISDFGLARVIGEDFIHRQAQSMGEAATLGAQKSLGEEVTQQEQGTSTRALLGTWEYMSPEQKRREEADARSDIFAVGLMCFRLLTGGELGMRPPSQLVKTLNPAWDDFIAKALEQQPPARYANGAEMLAAFASVQTASSGSQVDEAKSNAQPEPSTPSPQLQPPQSAIGNRQSKMPWLAVGLFALVFACLGGWYFGVRLPEQKRQHYLLMSQPWENTLGMKFAPVPGTKVLVGVWDVRVQDFEAFVNATKYDATDGMRSLRNGKLAANGGTWKSPGFSQGAMYPVCGVSWIDAKAFCDWLTQKEHSEGKLGERQSYRLPTDTEWSVAVGLKESSGGTPKDKDKKTPGVYPWGSQWPPLSGAGNYAGSEAKDGDWPSDWKTIEGYNDGYPRTSPVGSFQANRFGLYDMGGNVWQWCEDSSDSSQQSRVLRGASWRSFNTDYLLSSFRDYYAPGQRSNCVGFRCVVVDSSSR